ncbi:MAG: UvrD-helicase domain-containing protein [Burkholderiaceae bacterium]|nr:UvrD-helicase domain-containing protein [Burkholderiaceae bacterium]
MNLLENLNEQQLAAVTLPDQNALILAGAGSGKTRVLTTRIAWLIQTGRVGPHGILAVTFTNKAAREMLARISALLPINTRGMWIGTFHGLCNRLLRAHHRDAGLPATFQILDASDQLAAIKRLLKAANVDDQKYPPRNLQNFINDCKEAGLRAKDVEVNDSYNRKFVELYAAYDAQCQREGVVDFAELLLRCYELLDRNEAIRSHYQSRFRHILVDEFQDTNRLQYRWLKLLAGGGAAVFAVGDDDQCLVAGTQVTMADGRTVPIEDVKAGDEVRASIGAGEFGPARVMRVHRRPGVTELVTIHTRGGRKITSTPEHTHFAGYAVGEAPEKYFVYLMRKRGLGYRLGFCGYLRPGPDLRPVPGYRFRGRREGADAVWVIGSYDTPQEARVQEMLYSLRYGLPTLPFAGDRKPKADERRGGLSDDPKIVARVYKTIDTETAAKRLLADQQLLHSEPHETFSSGIGNEGDVLLHLGASRGRGKPQHRAYVRLYKEEMAQKVREAGFDVKVVTDGIGGWYVQFWRANYAIALREADRLSKITGGKLVQKVRVGDATLPFARAAAIQPGMQVFLADGSMDTVERVERHEPASTVVYDLDIALAHNFIANGIFTHNSIYAFRGAHVGNMADFEREFRVANVIKLEQNYRSHGHILDAANALIRHNARRLGKNLWTDAGAGEPVRVYEAASDGLEAAWLVDEIRTLVAEGLARREIAVLYRANAQSRVLEHALFSAGIPYRVYGGLRFFERAEVKHALAYLRLLENPDDDTAFLRVVNFPPRGVGARTLEQLADLARQAGVSLHAAAPRLGGRAGASLAAFVQLLQQLRRETAALPLPEIVDAVIDKSGLLAHYRGEKEGQERIENLQELVNAAAAFVAEEGYAADAPATRAEADAAIPSPLAAFLSHASLEAGENQAQEGQDAVQLMTVHAAKGLEFHAVFITGLEEGLFPHENSLTEADGLEEERRLMYVAITRARRRLYLSFAQSRLLHGQTRYGVRSRFLSEIPEQHLKWLTPRFAAYAAAPAREALTAPAFGAARVASAAASHGFRVGQSVRHARFGDGVIIKLEGSGADARAKINFGPAGVKELLLGVAKLEPA